jgi:hypothetical protein
MEDNNKNFLRRIQNAEEGKKRKILITLSAVSILAVLFIWINAFSYIIKTQTGGSQPKEGFSLGETFKGGAALVYDSMSGAMEGIKNKISPPENHEVNP